MGIVAALMMALTAIVAFELGRARTPGDDSADAGFLRDMQVHHAQAVEMSMLVRDRTEDPSIRLLAYDIALGQQQQTGQMFALLQSWGLARVTTSNAQMAWMTEDQDAHDDATSSPDASGPTSTRMPGMATADDLESLRGSQGAAAETMFLQLMIDHHRGGVAMASAAIELVDDDQVRRLAETMVQSQRAELVSLQDLLDRRTGSR